MSLLVKNETTAASPAALTHAPTGRLGSSEDSGSSDHSGMMTLSGRKEERALAQVDAVGRGHAEVAALD